MISKLQYDIVDKNDPTKSTEGNWNQRPRDIANFSRWAGHELEREIGWKVVGLKAPLEELSDAPVLYLSGDQELKFTPEQEAKLRDFVISGGLILANADCPTARTAFPPSFEAMGHRLFPKYEFRDLPPGHPIFTNQPYLASKWKSRQKVRGLSNGVRELLVLMPESDPSRSWQTHTDFRQDPAFQLGADVYLYAIDRQTTGVKGETYIIRPDLDVIGDRTARLARLMIGNNPHPEPGAWLRMAALFHNQYHVDVDTIPMKLDDKRLNHCRIAHLTGTGQIELKPQDRQRLVDYVKQGGTLIVDAAGGDTAFADSAAKELVAMFGPAAETGMKTPLAPENPVFNLTDAGIAGVTYRDIYRRQSVGNLKTPRLDGIQVGGHLAVFFSREDLTGGLVGEQVDGVFGYSPESATEIMRNLVLYSAFGVRPPPTSSASADAK